MPSRSRSAESAPSAATTRRARNDVPSSSASVRHCPSAVVPTTRAGTRSATRPSAASARHSMCWIRRFSTIQPSAASPRSALSKASSPGASASQTRMRRNGLARADAMDVQTSRRPNRSAADGASATTRRSTSSPARHGGGSRASSTATSKPSRASASASAAPTMPAPTTATSWLVMPILRPARAPARPTPGAAPRRGSPCRDARADP